jgi:hypothetical protein
MLRFVLRYLVTDRSTAWIYDHRVDWDRPIVALPAGGQAVRAA